jgi:DNA-binding transcriptional LysR family regulator
MDRFTSMSVFVKALEQHLGVRLLHRPPPPML